MLVVVGSGGGDIVVGVVGVGVVAVVVVVIVAGVVVAVVVGIVVVVVVVGIGVVIVVVGIGVVIVVVVAGVVVGICVLIFCVPQIFIIFKKRTSNSVSLISFHVTCKFHVFYHNRNSFSMNRADLRIIESLNEKRFSRLLQRQ